MTGHFYPQLKKAFLNKYTIDYRLALDNSTRLRNLCYIER